VDAFAELRAVLFRRRRKGRGAPDRTNHRIVERRVPRALRQLDAGQTAVGADRERHAGSQVSAPAHVIPRFLNSILYRLIVEQKLRVLLNPLAALSAAHAVACAFTGY